MDAPSSSRASSRSPTRQPKTSTGQPARQSPKRTPLHERSDSQKNAAYRQHPFPSLQSQVLAAKSLIFTDAEGDTSSQGPPLIPPKSPNRSPASLGSRSVGSAVEASVIGHDPLPEIAPLSVANQKAQTTSVQRADGDSPGRIRRRTLAGGAGKAAAEPLATSSPSKSTAEIVEPLATTAVRSGEPKAVHGPSSSTDSYAFRIRHRQASSGEIAGALPRHKSVERLRSQSSLNAKGRKRALTGTKDSPGSSGERPRSSSSPSARTDAFIQELINSGTNVQYPQLRKPSATSLRSESAFTVGAYPPPLRLQRKRANSQLAKAASIPPESLEPSSDGPIDSTPHKRIRLVPSETSFLTYTSEGSTTAEGLHPSYAVDNHQWTEELDDTVAELHAPSLHRQTSDVQSNSLRGLQHPSRESLRSSVGSFYHFLNDSRTAWAPVYYRGEDRLRLGTPPAVEQVVLRNDSEHLVRTPSPSPFYESPGSAGFPDRIYVPRIRPFARAMNLPEMRQAPVESNSELQETVEYDLSISSHSPANRPNSSSLYMSHWTDESPSPQVTFLNSSSSPEGTFLQNSSSPRIITDANSNSAPRLIRLVNDPMTIQAATGEASSSKSRPQTRRRDFSYIPPENITREEAHRDESDQELPLGPPVFNPTPELPYLAPTRKAGPWLPYWRAPSIDEYPSVLDRSNFQLALFCLGFLLPPAWWLAAILPLPRRPQWQRGKTRANFYGDRTNDLFDSSDVQRYQKTRWWRNVNRAMSLAGLLIVGAVIACVVVSTT